MSQHVGSVTEADVLCMFQFASIAKPQLGAKGDAALHEHYN